MNQKHNTAPQPPRVLRPATPLDIATAAEFKAGLRAMLDGERPAVIVDLSCVEYVDSAGLSALMAAVHSCSGAGGALRFCAARPAVRQALRATRLEEHLPLCLDCAQARRELGAIR